MLNTEYRSTHCLVSVTSEMIKFKKQYICMEFNMKTGFYTDCSFIISINDVEKVMWFVHSKYCCSTYCKALSALSKQKWSFLKEMMKVMFVCSRIKVNQSICSSFKFSTAVFILFFLAIVPITSFFLMDIQQDWYYNSVTVCWKNSLSLH